MDQVIAKNEPVYIKSYPMQIDTKFHIELHLTITTNQEDDPADKIIKAAEKS
jgi:hypothetical protein